MLDYYYMIVCVSVFKTKLALPVVLGLESRVSHIISFCSIPKIFLEILGQKFCFYVVNFPGVWQFNTGKWKKYVCIYGVKSYKKQNISS